MGLTIHYSLRSSTRSINEARTLVERLRQRALDLPFKAVGEIVDFSATDEGAEKLGEGDPIRWMIEGARQHVRKNDRYLIVRPKRLIAFSTSPGNGSETADFGLALYPASIPASNGEILHTGLKGWSWSTFCKTQYASDPSYGGVENFLRSHVSIVRLLDHARELGIVGEVHDEGGYWDKRDVQALVKEVGEWNTMIAGFVGSMKDLFDGDVAAPITEYPDYEHLEAKGRADAGGS